MLRSFDSKALIFDWSRSFAASGTGTFILSASGLQYDITVQGVSGAIIASHFHSGIVGISGPVVFTITFSGNRATGTWTAITNDQRNELLNHGTYVNVHTSIHPDGEIRGQLNWLNWGNRE
jgi:hypothetical protein